MTANQIAYQKVLEDKRSHLAGEVETNRSNLANEELKRQQNVETNRSNLVNENLKSQQNAETARSNRANESLQQQRNDETRRSNLANEALTGQRNAEQARSNRANESIAYATLSETSRANRANEDIRTTANNIQNFKNVTGYETDTARNKLFEQQNKLAGYKAIADIAVNQQNANSNSLNSLSRTIGQLIRR